MAPRLHDSEHREDAKAERGAETKGFSKWKAMVAGIALAAGVHACSYEGDGIVPLHVEDTGPDADARDAGPDADLDAGEDTMDSGPDAGPDTDIDAGPDTDLDAGPDAEVDAGPDAEVDAGPDAEVDAGPDADLDAGPDADLDAGPDAEVDAGPDAEVDAGPDAEVDAGPDADGGSDAGTVCPGVYEDSRLGLYAIDTDVEVGGYHIRFVGQISGGVEYDIRCAADSAVLEDNHPFMQGIEGAVLRPEDTEISVTGMRIRITNSSSSPATSTSNVVVEAAP